MLVSRNAHLLSRPSSSFYRDVSPSAPHRPVPILTVRMAPSRTVKVVACSTPSSLALRLEEAAVRVVDENVRSGMVIGLGSGYASAMAIQHLGRRLQGGDLKDIYGVAMSVSSATEAAKAGLPLTDIEDDTQVDFAFDDADVIEEGSLAAVVGRRKLEGRESILQEKRILKLAKSLTFIISAEQHGKDFEGSIPVVIQSGNWLETAEQLDDLFLGDAEVWRRPAFGPAGPMGGDFPLVTKEGHNIVDIVFTSPIPHLSRIAEFLDRIDGVIEHGLVVGVPCAVVIASEEGLQIIDNLSTVENCR